MDDSGGGGGGSLDAARGGRGCIGGRRVGCRVQDLQSAEKEAGDGANDNDRPLTVDGADELLGTTTV